jgi:hypothetical protein
MTVPYGGAISLERGRTFPGAGTSRGRGAGGLFLLALGVVFATSGFVRWEPAIFDILVLPVLVAGMFLFSFPVPRKAFLPGGLLVLFLIANMLPAVNLPGELVLAPLIHTIVTAYLMVVWVGLIMWGNGFREKALHACAHGYLVAALLSAILAIFGVLVPSPFSEQVTWAGRAVGFFKDPNVFGPFLVLPAVLSFARFNAAKGVGRKCLWGASLVVLCLGLFFSLSRGAWGNLGISLTAFAFLSSCHGSRALLRLVVIAIIILLVGSVVLAFAPSLADLASSRSSIQGYDTVRFLTQHKAFEMGLDTPLGVGGLQSRRFFGQDVHSTYVLVLAEYGWLGFLSFNGFMLLTLAKAVEQAQRKDEPFREYALVSLACLLGLMSSAAMVDTLHWRHLWIVTALPWALPPRGRKTVQGSPYRAMVSSTDQLPARAVQRGELA